MKKLILIGLIAIPSLVFADTHVDGYYRSNGTYVQPHYRSDSNGTAYDNYSYQGNTNPYTGTTGTSTRLDQGDTSYGTGNSNRRSSRSRSSSDSMYNNTESGIQY